MLRRVPFHNAAVAAVFAAYPPRLRARLLQVRGLIFAVASQTAGVGHVEETLKWGQPSYLTPETKSGSTVRLDALKTGDGCALYFHCATDLIARFKKRYPALTYEGKRAIVLRGTGALPLEALRWCVARALTYHIEKTQR